MRTTLESTARYALPVMDILEEKEMIDITPFVGKQLRMRFTGDIHCVVTGKKIKKTFGEGMSYDAWLLS